MALKSGSLNLNGMLETWRRFGWLLESAGVEDGVVEPGDVVTTAVDVSDAFVSTPDVEVVVVDTNGDLASALLALTLSASEFSENSWKVCDAIIDDSWMRGRFVLEFANWGGEFEGAGLTLSWSLLLAVVDTERGIDVLIVVTGWDTIELNSVDVVCGKDRNVSLGTFGEV